jgi:hypothetical protein
MAQGLLLRRGYGSKGADVEKNLSKFVWPATALLCAAVIGAGAYFGLKSYHSPAVQNYGVSTSDPTAGGAEVSQAASDETAASVYVTRTGECYHRGTCSYLRRSKIPMELSDAKRRYRPCSKCNPPR